MGVWYVRPFQESGWQVLTPCHTQASAVLGGQQQAIDTACTMIGDEGGGTLIVLTGDGQVIQTHQVPASCVPYLRNVPKVAPETAPSGLVDESPASPGDRGHGIRAREGRVG